MPEASSEASARMRILHLGSLYAPYAFGGAERVTEGLAEAQAALGHVVAVAHLAHQTSPDTMRNGVEVRPLAKRNLLWVEKTSQYPAPIRMLNKIGIALNQPLAQDAGRVMDEFKPDILHTHSMVEVPPMVWAEAKRRGIAVVHTLHDYDLLCARAALFRNGHVCETQHLSCAALSAWKRPFHKDIDLVVAVSQGVMDLHTKFGFFTNTAPERRRVIWNPLPPSVLRSPVQKDDTFTFGFLGRVTEEKGVDVLIEACRKLPPSGWKLKVAGNSPSGLEPWIAKAAGLPIEFIGFQDTQDFLGTIDVLAAPSIWAEPFGLTIVEAFRAGVPVIGSAIGGITDLVGRILPDWLVMVGDADSLADCMQRVLDAGRAGLPDPVLFQPVLDALTPEAIVDKYLNSYRDLLSPTSAAALGHIQDQAL